MASGTHTVLYELQNKRLNWVWFVNQPEPEVKVTLFHILIVTILNTRIHNNPEMIFLSFFSSKHIPNKVYKLSSIVSTMISN